MTVQNKKKVIRVNFQKCLGCFSCTLACSFHHTQTFFPERSSIYIAFDGEGAINGSVLPTCDLCPKERIPLCIEFCPVGAVSVQRHHSHNDSSPNSLTAKR